MMLLRLSVDCICSFDGLCKKRGSKMTKAQEALARHLLEKLDGCWNEDGELVEEYHNDIILPDLSKTALKTFKEIIGA